MRCILVNRETYHNFKRQFLNRKTKIFSPVLLKKWLSEILCELSTPLTWNYVYSPFHIFQFWIWSTEIVPGQVCEEYYPWIHVSERFPHMRSQWRISCTGKIQTKCVACDAFLAQVTIRRVARDTFFTG